MPYGDEREATFAAAVLDVVDSIPPGLVMSYGDVAALLGSRGARTVGTIMARYGRGHAWWRVVRSGGLPPRGHEERALGHYRDEGTPLTVSGKPEGYRVQYALARWDPMPPVMGATSEASEAEN